jgi:hypothetical protein
METHSPYKDASNLYLVLPFLNRFRLTTSRDTKSVKGLGRATICDERWLGDGNCIYFIGGYCT